MPTTQTPTSMTHRRLVVPQLVSDRLFLGGLLLSRAHLRFTGQLQHNPFGPALKTRYPIRPSPGVDLTREPHQNLPTASPDEAGKRATGNFHGTPVGGFQDRSSC